MGKWFSVSVPASLPLQWVHNISFFEAESFVCGKYHELLEEQVLVEEQGAGNRATSPGQRAVHSVDVASGLCFMPRCIS